jgi:hypothetical protein
LLGIGGKIVQVGTFCPALAVGCLLASGSASAATYFRVVPQDTRFYSSQYTEVTSVAIPAGHWNVEFTGVVYSGYQAESGKCILSSAANSGTGPFPPVETGSINNNVPNDFKTMTLQGVFTFAATSTIYVNCISSNSYNWNGVDYSSFRSASLMVVNTSAIR